MKLGQTPEERDVRHLHWLREELGDDLVDAVVITTGQAAYRRSDGIAVVPAALLGPRGYAAILSSCKVSSARRKPEAR